MSSHCRLPLKVASGRTSTRPAPGVSLTVRVGSLVRFEKLDALIADIDSWSRNPGSHFPSGQTPKSAVPKSAAFDSTRHIRSRKPVGLSRPSRAPLLSRVRQPALPPSITLPQALKSNHARYVSAPPPDRARTRSPEEKYLTMLTSLDRLHHPSAYLPRFRHHVPPRGLQPRGR